MFFFFCVVVIIGKIIENLKPEEGENQRPERHEHRSRTKRIYRRSGGARLPAEIRPDYSRPGRTQHRTQQPASQSPTAMSRGDMLFNYYLLVLRTKMLL